MKKTLSILAAALLLLSATGCGGADKSSGSSQSAAISSESPAPASSPDAATQAVAWPAELVDWAVPQPAGGEIALSDNRSIENGIITQGINVVVNINGVTKQVFDDYCKALEDSGFKKNPDSLAEVMVIYSKAVDGGAIELTLSYSDTNLTLVANNSAAASAEKPAGSADWPESAAGIPEFTKGIYKETVDMGGGMYAITYTGVTQSDLDWYRAVLLDADFVSQNEQDTEGYGKIDSSKAYSVGFMLTGDTLQLIVLSGSF